ncbi:MAG: flagellar motor switch protein FliG, partial [Desulfobacterales bacterium]
MVQMIDADNMTGVQKAAVFLMAMGEEYASQALENMNEREIATIAFEISQVEHITPEMFKRVFTDFVDRFEGETRMVVEGDSFIKNVVSKTLKEKEADAIFKDMEKRKQERPFIWSRNVNISTLSGYVEGE